MLEWNREAVSLAVITQKFIKPYIIKNAKLNLKYDFLNIFRWLDLHFSIPLLIIYLENQKRGKKKIIQKFN